MFKKIVSLILTFAMLVSFGGAVFAAEKSTEQVSIVVDNYDERVVKVGNVVATYDKNNNVMYVNDGGNSYSYSLNIQDGAGIVDNSTRGNKIIKSESVALHRYQWNRTDSGSYYWAVDIPSYSINPNDWCGWISLWDDGSEEAELAEEFADYIEDAQDAEHTLAVYGGATLVAAVVGLITENPEWSESTFKAVCAAAGVIVTLGVLDAGLSYFNNLSNARENYFAIRAILE